MKIAHAHARIKFLVDGGSRSSRLVDEELRDDEGDHADDIRVTEEKPIRQPGELPGEPSRSSRRGSPTSGLRPKGYHIATVKMPLGDYTHASRRLADVARHTGDTIRLTVEQNLCLRWVSGSDAVAFTGAVEMGLGGPEPKASRIPPRAPAPPAR